jgi:hypothetical protein
VTEATELVRLTETDVWAIQSSIKYDMTARLEGRNERYAGQSLREKVNRLIVEFAEAHAYGKEPPAEGVDVALEAEELWLIDKQLNTTYAGARELLVRVFRALIKLETMPLWGPGEVSNLP